MRLEWVDETASDPNAKGVILTKDDGTTLILTRSVCFQFGSKGVAARFSGCEFYGRSLYGQANLPQSITYMTSKNKDGKIPIKSGSITLNNTRLLNSITPLDI